MKLTVTIELTRAPKPKDPTPPAGGATSHLGGSHVPAPARPLGFARPPRLDEPPR